MKDEALRELDAEVAKLKAINADEHAEAEHYRTEASNVYLTNENLQEEIAKLKKRIEELEHDANVRGLERITEAEELLNEAESFWHNDQIVSESWISRKKLWQLNNAEIDKAKAGK